jgi:hypothetical protein
LFDLSLIASVWHDGCLSRLVQVFVGASLRTGLCVKPDAKVATS